MVFPLWLQAGFWGFVGGASLLIGAAVGYFVKTPQRVIAAITAFGSGVLISALSLDLMQEAFERGGFLPTGVGFLVGALIYTLADRALDKKGAETRKESGHEQPDEAEEPGSGLAIAVGALIDGIPESIVIGVSLIGGARVSLIAVIAVFLSNFPEGLSSAAGMKKAGRSPAYIFGVWGGIVLASAVAATVGYSVFSNFPDEVIAAVTAIAAGAILTMIADTMLPEAFKFTAKYTGIVAVIGFLIAFILSKLEG